MLKAVLRFLTAQLKNADHVKVVLDGVECHAVEIDRHVFVVYKP